MNSKKQNSGIRNSSYKPFIPSPLPPKLIWTPELTRALSDADRAIGQLSGEGKQLLNLHLMIRPFVKREAVLSSRIEGTQTTLGELLANDAGASVKRSPDDLREVDNYVKALDYGISRLKELPLSLRLIREIHGKLMEGVRGDQATPGEFRRSQNWIGPAGCTLENATYIPPPPDQLIMCLGQLEKFVHDRNLPPLVQAGLIHYQFEAIHPFLDGNGRTGRLLTILFFIERGILTTPMLYLSAFFEATRNEYYDRLLAVTQKGQWDQRLQYFLNAVARMSEDAVSRAERINTLINKWRKLVSDSPSKIPSQLVELLAENPYWTINKITQRLDVAFTTAQRSVDKLISLKILSPVGYAKRDRVFCANDIMAILDEPAKLKPSGKNYRD